MIDSSAPADPALPSEESMLALLAKTCETAWRLPLLRIGPRRVALELLRGCTFESLRKTIGIVARHAAEACRAVAPRCRAAAQVSVMAHGELTESLLHQRTDAS